MQDAIRYGAPALTIDEARALAARISDVIRQRDELREEVTYWRQVMAELAALRAFLHDDAAGAMGVPAASNGHLAHAPTDVAGDPAPDLADDDLSNTDVEPEPDDTTSELDANAVDDDPAARDRDETAAERRGETDASNLYIPLHSNEMNSELGPRPTADVPHGTPVDIPHGRPVDDAHRTLVGNAELVTRPTADDRHSEQAGDDHDSATSGPDTPAVVDAEPPLHTGEPKASDHGETAAVVMVSDDTAPASSPVDDTPGRPADDRAELCIGMAAVHLQNPLVSADCKQADNAAASESKTPADNTELGNEIVPLPPAAGTYERPPQGTLMERILTAIEASDRPRRGWHLQRELGLPRVPTPELSRLVKRGFLTRHGESIYGVAGRDYDRSKSC